MTDYTFTIGTYNLHALAVRRNPNGVFEDIKRFMGQCDALALQEAGEAGPIIKRAVKELGVEVFDGYGKVGQAATPILFKRKDFDDKSVPLTPSTFVGEPGAGPNTMKAKWLNLVRFRAYGRNIWVSSIHTTPSVYIRVRKELALRQTRLSAAACEALSGLKFIGGDYNSLPGSDIRRPLESVGMASAQRLLGPIKTFGNRSIDDVHFSNNKYVKAVRHWERKGVSDHDAYFVEFAITPSRKWLRNHTKDEPVPARFKHLHSSSRFDRSLESLEKATRAYVEASPFVTFTEVAFEKRERVLRKVGREVGYGVISGDASNADDCAIMFDKKRFELVYKENFKSATQVIYRTDGVKRDLPYSLIAVFKDRENGKTFVVSVGHYASGVEGALAKNDQTYRRAIQWRQSSVRTKNRVNALAKEYKADARLVVADWNVNFKRAWVRAMVKAQAPSYTNAWKNVNVPGGTHGKRIIDGTIFRGDITLRGSATLFEDDASSDHRPYVETFVWS